MDGSSCSEPVRCILTIAPDLRPLAGSPCFTLIAKFCAFFVLVLLRALHMQHKTHITYTRTHKCTQTRAQRPVGAVLLTVNTVLWKSRNKMEAQMILCERAVSPTPHHCPVVQIAPIPCWHCAFPCANVQRRCWLCNFAKRIEICQHAFRNTANTPHSRVRLRESASGGKSTAIVRVAVRVAVCV